MTFQHHTKAINKLTNLASGLLFAALIILPLTTAQAQERTETDAIERERIETIIREYLLKNPEIMLEVQSALQQKQQAEIEQRQQETLTAAHSEIYSGAYQIEIGSEAPDAVTVVEFFDYNCGFCQRAMEDMERLIEDDKSIRFVLKEFPVLGEASIEASRVSMAFSKVMPEKHAEFHIDLLGLEGVKNGERAIELAVSMGANRAAIEAEMEDPGIIETIQTTYELANALGITGTPSYVIGNELIFGAVGYDQLKQQIEALKTQ